MTALKTKGDAAELAVAADLRRRGFTVLFPFGEASAYDLVVDRCGSFERVQVKYTESRNEVVAVRCRSQSLTNGKVRSTHHYTATDIDWLAVFDGATGTCYYVPASLLGAGRSLLHLRLTPARNNQTRGIRLAADYLEF